MPLYQLIPRTIEAYRWDGNLPALKKWAKENGFGHATFALSDQENRDAVMVEDERTLMRFRLRLGDYLGIDDRWLVIHRKDTFERNWQPIDP